MQKQTIELSDFTFWFSGPGQYKVTYTSPETEQTWTTITANMPLIDLTKDVEKPATCDLELLKRLCQRDPFWFA